jgi:hypothetical protein
MLKAIGYWMTGLDDELQPAPQELVGEMPAEHRGRLIAYLAAGMIHEQYLGYTWCRVGCQIDPAQLGTKELSDGTWVWPEGLAHYVREHRILLPEVFVCDALTKPSPVIPGWADKNGPLSEHKVPADERYWQQWCSSRRAPQFLDELRARRLAAKGLAAADSAADTNQKITELMREHGLGDANCVWKGCTRKALAGRYICADHSVEKDEDPRHRLAQEFGKLLSELNAATGLQPIRPQQPRLTGLIARKIAQFSRLLRRL